MHALWTQPVTSHIIVPQIKDFVIYIRFILSDIICLGRIVARNSFRDGSPNKLVRLTGWGGKTVLMLPLILPRLVRRDYVLERRSTVSGGVRVFCRLQ